MMEFVNGKDDIPYMRWKIIQMFETTNQNNHWYQFMCVVSCFMNDHFEAIVNVDPICSEY